jgi:hypothetical protein
MAQVRSVSMTLIGTPPTRRRIDPIADHVYTLPVVRELPAPVIDAAGLGTW